MIIHLDKSKLFTVDPSIRFANEYGVSVKTWPEIWRRYKLLEYTVSELREYIHIYCGKKIQEKSICRWIFRQEVYLIAYQILKKGAITVSSEIFNKYEAEVIKELLKHMKNGDSKTAKSLL